MFLFSSLETPHTTSASYVKHSYDFPVVVSSMSEAYTDHHLILSCPVFVVTDCGDCGTLKRHCFSLYRVFVRISCKDESDCYELSISLRGHRNDDL